MSLFISTSSQNTTGRPRLDEESRRAVRAHAMKHFHVQQRAEQEAGRI